MEPVTDPRSASRPWTGGGREVATGADPRDRPVAWCRGLRKAYRRIQAVRDVSFEVHPGEIVALLGPNGAGKSTTILMALGLIRPDAGSAAILGAPVPAPYDTMRRVGVMFERPSFYPWLSGRRNLEVFLGRRGLPPTAIDDAIDRVGLHGAAGRKVKGYSHGMRQRLGLAVALAGKPGLLVLDEPAGGLDPEGIRAFRSILAEEAERGAGVLLSSHMLSEVERSCHRAVFLAGGRVIAEGSVKDLLRARTLFEVVVDPNDRAHAVTLLAAYEPQVVGPDRLLVPSSGAVGSSITEVLASGGVFPESVSERSPTLEDLFFELTEGDPGGAAG